MPTNPTEVDGTGHQSGAPRSTATLSGAYQEINQLGQLTGHAARRVDRDLTEVHDRRTCLVRRTDEGLTSITSLTPPTTHWRALRSWLTVEIARRGQHRQCQVHLWRRRVPQLSAEYVVSATRIDLSRRYICCHVNEAPSPSAADSTTSAVVHHHVIGLNDDIASRWDLGWNFDE